MTEEKQREDQDLLSVVELVRLLYAKRWLIVGGTLIAGVLFAFYAKTRPDVYEAETTLILSQPQIPITGEARPLSVGTLQSLTESPDVMYELFEQAISEGVLEETAQFAGFQSSLLTSIETGGRGAADPLPMLSLRVRSLDYENAAKIANMWAEIVTARTKNIYWQSTDDFSKFINNISKDVEDSLTAKEDLYTSALIEANQAVNEAALASSEKSYSEQYDEFLKLTAELNRKEALLASINTALLEQMIDGSWVGDILQQRLLTDAAEPLAGLPQTSSTKRIWAALKEISKYEELLVALEKDSQRQFLEMALSGKGAELTKITSGILEASSKHALVQQQHAKLAELLENIPKKIELLKAVTDDVLFQLAIEGLLQADVKLPFLKSEVVNPVFYAIQQQVVEMAGEIEGLKSRAAFYEQKKEDLKGEVTELAVAVAESTEQHLALSDALTANRAMLTTMREQYQNDRGQVETLEGELEQAGSFRASAAKELEKLESEIGRLEQLVFTNQQQLDAQLRLIEDLIAARASVAPPAQEVAHLMATAREASRSGATILFQAQANPLSVASSRSRMVLAGMLVSFVLLCFLMVGVRMIREN